MSNNHYETGSISAPRRRGNFRHVGDLVGNDPLQYAELYASAPWHSAVSYRDEALVSQYLRAGFLPDGLPEDAIYSDDWERRCVVLDSELRRMTMREGGVIRREKYSR